jgi:hypothetical protein
VPSRGTDTWLPPKECPPFYTIKVANLLKAKSNRKGATDAGFVDVVAQLAVD